MGRPPTYSEEQRSACVRAAMERRMLHRDIVGAARKGELEEGLEPFEVSAASISAWLVEEQRQAVRDVSKRAGELDLHEAAELYTRTIEILSDQLRHFEQQSRKGPLDRDDFDRLRAFARALNEVGTFPRRAKTAQPPAEEGKPEEPAEPEPSPEMQAILSKHRAEQHGPEGNRTPKGNGTHANGSAAADDDATHNDGRGGVHGRANAARDGS